MLGENSPENEQGDGCRPDLGPKLRPPSISRDMPLGQMFYRRLLPISTIYLVEYCRDGSTRNKYFNPVSIQRAHLTSVKYICKAV